MTNKEIWIAGIKEGKGLRKQITNPSEETLMGWKLQDLHDQMILEMLEKKEAEAKTIEEDFPNVKLTSDIRVKK